jgi:hypothetical protein
LAYSYNVDYWDGKSSVEISADMLKLRYANYPKDYFLGVLPSSQYGSVAVLPSVIDSNTSGNTVYAPGNVNSVVFVPSNSVNASVEASQPYNRNLVLNSDFSLANCCNTACLSDRD